MIDLVAVLAFVAFFGINAHFIKKAEEKRHTENMIVIAPEDTLVRNSPDAGTLTPETKIDYERKAENAQR